MTNLRSILVLLYQSAVVTALLLVSSTFAFAPVVPSARVVVVGGRNNGGCPFIATVPGSRPNFGVTAAVQQQPPPPPHSSLLLVRSALPLSTMEDAWMNSGLQLLIATIDSDVANIPDNEFASVFAGGILVMFGGLFSALMVGFILEKRNLYANIVAESYAQGGDEEFWKNLSAEEKTKAQSLLAQLKESKEGASASSSENVVGKSGGSDSQLSTAVAAAAVDTSEKPIVVANTTKEATKVVAATTAGPSKEKKPMGMFSDYDDD
jgi:hypothetical protein